MRVTIRKVEIRLLTPADSDEFWRLRLEALECDPPAFAQSADEHRQISVDEFRSRLSDPSGCVAGAFAAGKMIGMAAFHRESHRKLRHKGWVWGVYVSPPYRRRGLAKTLMEKLIGSVRQMDGITQMNLSVTLVQTAAVQLYRELGFQTYGRESNSICIDGKLLDQEYLTLVL